MKTNVVMIRKMGGFQVAQRTKDGMFNATSLLSQWNSSTGMKKEMGDFFDNQNTTAFIEVLNQEENLHGGNSPYVKSKASRGENAGTWMHPILFIKFAMWLNPRFEYHVIRFVYDELIKFRNDAGDNYRTLTKAVAKLKDVNYPQLAKGLNYSVFGRHDEGLRQNASEMQLKKLNELENQLAFAVDFDLIKSYSDLIEEIRKIYHSQKYLTVA